MINLNKHLFLGLLIAGILAIGFVNPTGTLNAMPDDEVPTNFVEWDSNPIYGQYVGDGKAYYPCVIKINDQYRMYFDAGSGTIKMLTSTDGVEWSNLTTMSGLSSAYHPTVIYHSTDFGTTKYKIYYWDGTTQGLSTRTAYSTDGVTWTSDQAITQDTVNYLQGGAYSTWWYHHYGPAQVIYNPDATNTGTNPWSYSYVMTFDTASEGRDEVNDIGIEHCGLAYSQNGLHWIRYGTTPIIWAGYNQNSEDDYAYHGIITHVDDNWRLWYIASDIDEKPAGVDDYAQGIKEAYSSDGLTWVSFPNPIFHVSDNVAWRDVRTYTPWVINDEGQYKMWFSGKTSSLYSIGYATQGDCYISDWSLVYQTANQNEFFWGIANNGDRYVVAASGDGNGIFTSDDTQTWTPRSIPFDKPIYVVSYANGLFVAGGWRGALITSPDGITWTDRSPSILEEFHGIAYNPNLSQWLAVTTGTPSLTYSSYDNGQTWQLVNSSNGIKADLIYVNGQYVAVGNTSIYTSTNGTSWTVSANLSGQLTWFRAICYAENINGGTYVAVGYPGAIFTSTNLTTWTQQTITDTGIIYDVTYTGAELIAVGENSTSTDGLILTSPDGTTWTEQSSDTLRHLLGVTYNSNQRKAVAVGCWSNIVTSDCEY